MGSHCWSSKCFQVHCMWEVSEGQASARAHKKLQKENGRASDVEIDGPSEFENAMDEITEGFDASEKDAKSQSEDN